MIEIIKCENDDKDGQPLRGTYLTNGAPYD